MSGLVQVLGFAQSRFANPLVFSALVASLVGCVPPPAADQPIVVTPTATPTPTPTPVPTFDTGFRITTMTVAESSSEALDLDDDGRTDNGIANALKELGNFLNDRIKNVLGELLADGTIDQQTYTAIVGASTAAIKTFFSVQTVNQSLAQALETNPWLEHLYTTGPAEVGQDYWVGEADSGDYLLVTNMGHLDGSYDAEYAEISTDGGTVVLDLSFALGTTSLDLAFDLEDARSEHFYVDGLQLQDAKLGGGISVSALEELVQEILKKLGLLPFFDKQQLDELEADLNALLNDIADIELDSGENAVSASLLYGAQPATISGEASPTPEP